MTTQNLAQAIVSGKAIDIENIFRECMSNKIMDLVAEKRSTIAQNMFKEDVNLSEAVKEKILTPEQFKKKIISDFKK